MSLPRFYPVFDDVRWLERMVPLGVKLVQLRIKDTPRDEIKAQLQAGKDLCAEHGAIMVVNDYWELAIELGCDWLHLGQEDLDEADLDAIRAAGLKLGVSTHDNDELDRVLAFNPDYVALGPVYPTILKKMKWHQQGLGKVTEWKNLLGDTPLCAIGGMSVERAPGAFEAGADIVAAVTDITLNEDPEARVRAWLGVCA
ncbi:thiamine phosphate synthase [Cognatishimia activa]|uniref:Thiamine-phosphate synthase n=1 Tax=Cognatishimia activa TaxID=1715691 RepID=A0A0N7MC72_9RHOB|nr:thiamine phosphate synthase [Cognatishimia activa]CUI48889.1 Thiamine-phosphate synthase [Cognatishimia activa]CUK27400.1 Thiamine-phosphate synthase [Cognatishimia activa]